MNPSITAFMNGAARIDDRPVAAPDGTRIDDRMLMRTAEVDFRAAVNPYADAVAILSLEGEPAGGFGVDLEGGLLHPQAAARPRVGAARPQAQGRPLPGPIGNVNRLHMHDLPWTTRPLAIAKFLGTESGDFFESGYNPVGSTPRSSCPRSSRAR